MSEETLDFARRVLDMMNRRDVDELIAISDVDVEWHSLFAIGAGGVHRGHEGTRDYMRNLDDAWEEGYSEVTSALAVDDLALCVGCIHYRGKDSGVEGTAPVGWVLKFRDGKINYFRAFQDPARVLGALGTDG